MGTDLRFNSYTRATPSIIAAELAASPPNTDAKPPTRQKRLRGGWEAQIHLYGLKCEIWTLVEMKSTLRTALQSDALQVDDNLSRVEQTCNEKWFADNITFQEHAKVVKEHVKEVKERVGEGQSKRGKYATLSWGETRVANQNKRRFLKEVAMVGDVRGLLGLSGKERLLFHREAERQGLCHESTGDYGDKVLVVGKRKEDVTREISRIDIETHEREQIDKEKREGRWQAERDGLDRMHKEVLENGDNGDITGTWQLTMPELRYLWGNGGDKLRWHIAGADDIGNMWGTVDVTGEGILRIDWEESHLPWKDKEKPFVWMETKVRDPEQECVKTDTKGSVLFMSANTCSGMWEDSGEKYEFTGRKISKEIGASVEGCEVEFQSAMERYLEYLEWEKRWCG
jgi:hypothetical protein